MIIVACDPGRITSYAKLDSERPFDIEVGEFELVGSGRLLRPCAMHIAEVIADADCAIVEEVGARPKEGASAIFTFGLSVGSVLNALTAHAVPLETVTPPVWKASAKLSKVSKEESKSAARRMATEIWPQHRDVFRVKKNHGMAEAGLMARWYFLKGPGRDVPVAGDLAAAPAAAA